MLLTEEFIKTLPLTDYDEDFDNIDEITAITIKEFNEIADKIDLEFLNESNNTTKVSDKKNHKR